MLRQMARARRFNQWMADTVAPYVQGNTIELGAGIGNLAALLHQHADRYIATDTDPDHLRQLSEIPAIETALCDAASCPEIERLGSLFDTVIALNVLEHIPDDVGTLRNIRQLLKPGGRAIVLVPQGPEAFGSLDLMLEHQRRYREEELRSKLQATGFLVEEMIRFNRVTYPGWIFNSRLLRRTTLSTVQLRLLDFFVPLLRRVDKRLPWPPTSLIAVARCDDARS